MITNFYRTFLIPNSRNNTNTEPVDAACLQSVAGCGSSPVVSYEGTGAYFLDKLENGVWRLEVMPDAVTVNDPFAKPSLKKEVVAVVNGAWDMALHLPDLGNAFTAVGLNDGNNKSIETENGILAKVTPGAYLLKRKDCTPAKEWNKDTRWQNIRLGEYAMPDVKQREGFTVVNYPAKAVEAGKDLVIDAQVIGPSLPDSVIVYTDRISFWNEKNPYIKMERTYGYTYRALVPGSEVSEGMFRYNIVTCSGKVQQTFPGNVESGPLDWDYIGNQYWETKVVATDSKVMLVAPVCGDGWNGVDHYTLPEGSNCHFLKKYIREEVVDRTDKLSQGKSLCIKIKGDVADMKAGFITSVGYTYKADCPEPVDGVVRVPLDGLQQTVTALLPHAYPIFLKEYFEPTVPIPFSVNEIETLEVSATGQDLAIESAWIE